MPPTAPRNSAVVRLGRFLCVGMASAVVQFSVLWVAKNFLPPTVAFTVSFLFGTAAHYLLNRFWALPSSRADTGQQFGEYLLAVGISYAINTSLFTLCHAWLKLDVMWSAVCAVPPSTLVVFALLNYRVFKAHPR